MDERMKKLFQPKHTTTFLQPDQQEEARLLQNSQKSKLDKFIVSHKVLNSSIFSLIVLIGTSQLKAKEAPREQKCPYPTAGTHTLAHQFILRVQVLAPQAVTLQD